MSKARQLAIGGGFSALSLMLMYMSLFMPLTYLWVYFSGFMIMVIVVEAGRKTAFTAYIAVALLCFILLPNIMRAMAFTALIGHYPAIKGLLDGINSAFIRKVAKAAIFISAAAIQVFISVQLLGIPIAFTFGQFEHTEILFAIAVSQPAVFYIVYDYILGSIHDSYITKLRPKLFHGKK